tara:strand:- start:46 stop:417 length:372 start_codon:yes stop_codon:yes gene_type:complete
MIYWYFKNNELCYTSDGAKLSTPTGYTMIESEQEVDLTKTYRLVDSEITITGDAPILSPEQLKKVQWETVREKRNKLLTESDWTQLPDIPQATKDLWEPYRQELRDVTNQPDPYNITWPTPPQ